jgi:raffinose/stachyose/melibiose transport system permease protein
MGMSKRLDPFKPKLPTLLIFLGPTVVLLSVFLIWPIIDSFRLSFYDWSGLNVKPKLIGFGNWEEMLKDKNFWLGVRNGFILLFMSIGIQIPFSLGLALLLYRGGERFRIFKFTYFFPFLMSSVAVGILFRQVFDPNFGLINSILNSANLEALALDWIGDPKIAIYSVSALVCWQYIPFYILLFLAALNGISSEVEEAAAIDGAENWKLIRQIQIPLIRGSILTAITLMVIGSLKYFDLMWVMTGGGPLFSTSTMATYLYQVAFKSYRVGYGSTIASALFIVVFTMAILINFLTRRNRTEN